MALGRRTLYLDLETRSCADLRKTGVYRYAKDPTTDVILAAWMVDKGEPEVWHRGEPLPAGLAEALADPDVLISAHNFTFERQLHLHVLAPQYGWPEIPLERWDCTMARARACGLPGSLDGALSAMGSRVSKDREGHALMLRMCRPRSIDAQGQPVWWEDADKIERLGEYCAWDIKGGRWLDQALPDLIPAERELWLATERVNDRGVRFDVGFCEAALAAADHARDMLDREMAAVTGREVKRASNVGALKWWLQQQGIEIGEPSEDDEDDEPEEAGLRRGDVDRLLSRPTLPEAVRRALEIRLEAGKTSTRKLNAILGRAEKDGRVRGLLAYHGAATGRFSAAGSGVQIQNFPRNVVADWDSARAALADGAASVDALFGPPLSIISQMLRGSIIAGEGREIINADYSSVEAVGVAWLAGCDRLVEMFAQRKKVYEEMAASVWRVPVASIAKDSMERFVGKTLVLGAGYGMGAVKFQATCEAQGKPVSEEVAKLGIDTYRSEFHEIPALWRELDRAAVQAVREPGKVVWAARRLIGFRRDGRWLRMRLPSGREIQYRDPSIETDERFGTPKLVYWGGASKTRSWGLQSTYGGRLTENAVQGLCRDLMTAGMMRLEADGYEVITTVHDEILVEVRVGAPHHNTDHAIGLMCQLPAWAEGFPLRAEGRRGRRYEK